MAVADVAQIPVEGILGVDHAADAGTDRPGARTAADEFLDAVLGGVVELVAARAEDLDAVVGHRVVRRGDHHAELGVVGAGQMGDRRGRQHPDPQSVDALAGQACDDGGFEHLAAGSRVTADDREPARSDPASLRTRPPYVPSRAAADPSASANSAVRSRLATPRTPSVPNSRPMRTLLDKPRACAP